MAEATNIADNINAISPKKGLQAVRSASRKSHIRCQIRYRLVSNHKKTAAHFPVGFLAWGMNASYVRIGSLLTRSLNCPIHSLRPVRLGTFSPASRLLQ
jgi:hypothetical protein